MQIIKKHYNIGLDWIHGIDGNTDFVSDWALDREAWEIQFGKTINCEK